MDNVKKGAMKRIPLSLTEKELALIEAVLRKAKSQFLICYKALSKKRDEEMDLATKARYVFYRDSSLISEKLSYNITVLLEKEGTQRYDFTPFEEIIDNTLKGTSNAIEKTKEDFRDKEEGHAKED